MADNVTSPPPFTGSRTAGEWTARRYADVQAVLADDRFGVPAAGPPGPVGTISWLRASVSRFANGPEHQRRRARAVAELAPLHPAELSRAAHERAGAALRQAARPGERVDVMALLARRVPMAVMAGALGVARAQDAAEAVIKVAAGYFPGSDPATQPLADRATAQLLVMFGLDDAGPGVPNQAPGPLAASGQPGAVDPGVIGQGVIGQGVSSPGPAGLDVVVARIALMVQACDATAGLIGIALHFLTGAADAAAGWPTATVLDEVLRHRPVVRASRRVARAPVSLGGHQVEPGDVVVCDVETANLDAVRGSPGQPPPPSLTFGSGLRPCPGQPQALALATGVIEAIRDTCALHPGQPIDYAPSQPLRLPQRLEVTLR